MAKHKPKPLIKQVKAQKLAYRAKTEDEGKAIVAACLAATRIYDYPVYVDHTLCPISALLRGYWKEIEDETDFAEGTSFSRLIFVQFRGGQAYFIAVTLEGVLEGGEVKWGVKYIAAPGHGDILSHEELGQFST